MSKCFQASPSTLNIINDGGSSLKKLSFSSFPKRDSLC